MPLPVKMSTEEPGAFGLLSSRFKKFEGSPAAAAFTLTTTEARMPPDGALYDVLPSGVDFRGVSGEMPRVWSPR
jgi:hypothetical protein